MTPTPESVTVSQANGKFCESFVREKIPDFEYTGGHIDGFLDGKLVEIKSCQKTIRNGGRATTAGRFYFDGSQHQELLDNEGVYVLLVHDEGKVLRSKIIKASAVFWEFEGKKKAAWTSIFEDKDRYTRRMIV